MKACSVVGSFRKKSTARKAMTAKRKAGAKGLRITKAKKGYKLLSCK